MQGVFSKRLEVLLTSMYLKEKAMFWGANVTSGRAEAETPDTGGHTISGTEFQTCFNVFLLQLV